MKHEVFKLEKNGTIADCGEFGSPVFTGEDGLDRALDLCAYLGGDHVVFTETHKGYRIIRKNRRFHALILNNNSGPDIDPGGYIAYNYVSNGDGYGRSVYCGSKYYKTFKGAAKKAHEYLR